MTAYQHLSSISIIAHLPFVETVFAHYHFWLLSLFFFLNSTE